MKKTTFGKLLALSLLIGSIANITTGTGRSVFAQTWGINTPPTESSIPPTPPLPHSPTPHSSDRETAPLITNITAYQQYGQVIDRTKSMIRDPEAQRLAAEKDVHDLEVFF
ncbi:MAG: hypothetical protein AAGL17_18635, partial [Cyanobacteria bacterium J06576_12]